MPIYAKSQVQEIIVNKSRNTEYHTWTLSHICITQNEITTYWSVKNNSPYDTYVQLTRNSHLLQNSDGEKHYAKSYSGLNLKQKILKPYTTINYSITFHRPLSKITTLSYVSDNFRIDSINIAENVSPLPKSSVIRQSDVDINIPKTKYKNDNTFCLIIANENYLETNISSVNFAHNDGMIFKEYCNTVLGIPEENITFYTDATLNQIRAGIKHLCNISETRFDNLKQTNLIVYYTGHGIPDISNKTGYLLPYDGYVDDISSAYSLSDMYGQLGNTSANQITVMLDACFSGGDRNNQSLYAHAKGIAIDIQPTQPKGNMVVLSAASGNEMAYPYKDKQHGLFTYFLLKKLQDTKGNVTIKELGDYIKQNVREQSNIEYHKIQTPSIIFSPSIINRENIKLIK